MQLSVSEAMRNFFSQSTSRKIKTAVLFLVPAIAFLLMPDSVFAADEESAAFTGKQIKMLVFNLLGGIALLIYGINRMGEGLQKAAGDRMRAILARITARPVHGVLVGAGITALIQSSSATTVMVVGFVNARLMTLVQAVGVVIGANIGTTITGQLIAFKLTDYALPILAVGVGLHLFAKRRIVKHLGLFLLGFGILFLGLVVMKDGVHFIKDNPMLARMFETFGEKPLLGVFAGMLMTSLVQSSSTTIGIAIILASTGALTLEQAVPIILGDNIGTCITAGLASIGTSRNARRAALAHVMFNVIGTVIILLLLKPYIWLIAQTSPDIERQAANAHTIFNVFNTLIFLPFVPMFARLVERLVSKGTEDKREAVYLEERLLTTPAVALDQATKELARMAGFVSVSLRSIEKATRLNRVQALNDIEEDEDVVDELHKQTTAYLVRISERSIGTRVARKIPAVISAVDLIERIGDSCVILKDLIEEKTQSKAEFSDIADADLTKLQDLVVDAVEDIQRALAYKNLDLAETVRKNVTLVEIMTRQMRQDHIDRLTCNECSVHAGVFYLEIIKQYEAIANRCQSIASSGDLLFT